MTTDDALALLLLAADEGDRQFGWQELAEWPEGFLKAMSKAGVLRRTTTTLSVACPECEGAHVEPVTVIPDAAGQQRWFIRCPDHLRVAIDPALCERWEVDTNGLARSLALLLDVRGRQKGIQPGRLWRLGRIKWKEQTREVLFATGLCRDDARSVAVHVGEAGQSIVLVPHFVPDELLWPGRTPAVVPLSDICLLDDNALVLDGHALLDAVSQRDEVAEATSLLPLDAPSKRHVLRKQIKAEIKAYLIDDVLVQAYRQHRDYRSAARALTEELQQPVSKDRVFRAVKRAGGAAAVLDQMDSASVARSVASQPRDRREKMSKYRE